MSFKSSYSFEERKKESDRVLSKFPDRIPVICEKLERSKIKENVPKKYLVPKELNLSALSIIIKKKLNMRPETAIFIVINGKMMAGSNMNDIYNLYKDEDGFLYAKFSEENVFG